jgi:NitT/TauT family transport system permease protein
MSYVAIKHEVFENVYISAIEVFESVPVISFFPIVLVLFVSYLGVPGVEMAVLFLVLTATAWNIWMGQYQAFKTVPKDLIEVAENLRFDFWDKMTKVYIPYSIPRIASNLLPSFSDGLFYITVSEVFSVGNSEYSVFGIGSLIASFTASGNYLQALQALGVLGVVVVINVLVITKFADYAISKYGFETESTKVKRRGKVRVGLSAKASATASKVVKVARFTPLRGRSYVFLEEEEEGSPQRFKLTVGKAYAILGVSLILIAGVPIYVYREQVMQALPYTPQILLGLGFDYVRVAVVTLIALGLAVFGGYFLATHPKIEKPVIAFLQTFSAFPATAYFPLLYLATFTIIYPMLGPFASEFYVVLLAFISTFYYVFYEVWLGIKNIPKPVWELMDNLEMGFWARLRKIVLPGVLPYMVTGLSSTVNSAWGGLAVGEYWPNIIQGRDLQVSHGLMLYFALWNAQGDVELLAWGSFVFGIIVAIYSILFTRKLMDLSRKKYVMEETVYLV